MSVPKEFHIVIPARYASTRFPGKVLVEISGKPMIQHVYERALASGASSLVIATDEPRVEAAAQSFGAQVVMTSTAHPSGTDRIAEVATKLGWSDETIVVNVQGDEPCIAPENIAQVAALLAEDEHAFMATLGYAIDDIAQFQDPNIVKVVSDKFQHALYFSRAMIPWYRDAFADDPKHLPESSQLMAHVGLYAYRVKSLRAFIDMPAAPLEQAECLEQLRVLWHGEKIKIACAKIKPVPGIDTPEDLKRRVA